MQISSSEYSSCVPVVWSIPVRPLRVQCGCRAVVTVTITLITWNMSRWRCCDLLVYCPGQSELVDVVASTSSLTVRCVWMWTISDRAILIAAARTHGTLCHAISRPQLLCQCSLAASSGVHSLDFCTACEWSTFVTIGHFNPSLVLLTC